MPEPDRSEMARRRVSLGLEAVPRPATATAMSSFRNPPSVLSFVKTGGRGCVVSDWLRRGGSVSKCLQTQLVARTASFARTLHEQLLKAPDQLRRYRETDGSRHLRGKGKDGVGMMQRRGMYRRDWSEPLAHDVRTRPWRKNESGGVRAPSARRWN